MNELEIPQHCPECDSDVWTLTTWLTGADATDAMAVCSGCGFEAMSYADRDEEPNKTVRVSVRVEELSNEPLGVPSPGKDIKAEKVEFVREDTPGEAPDPSWRSGMTYGTIDSFEIELEGGTIYPPNGGDGSD